MLHKKQIIQHKICTKGNQLSLKDFQGKKVIILDWNFRNITLHGEELRDSMSLA